MKLVGIMSSFCFFITFSNVGKEKTSGFIILKNLSNLTMSSMRILWILAKIMCLVGYYVHAGAIGGSVLDEILCSLWIVCLPAAV